MSCGGSRDRQIFDQRRLFPVELRDALWRDVPFLQPPADAEAGNERYATRAEHADHAAIEMIVMVVRNDDGIERRQIIQRQRWWVEPSRAGEADRRDPLCP